MVHFKFLEKGAFLMNRTRAKKILAFLLAALIALSALSGVIMVFAQEPTPNLEVIDSNFWHLSGRSYVYSFDTDASGLPLPAGFWDRYRLEAEILEGEEYLKSFFVEEKEGIPTLTVEAEDGFIQPAGGVTVRYRLRCADRETGALLCYNTMILRAYLTEISPESVLVCREDPLAAVTFGEDAGQGELVFEDVARFVFPLSEQRTFFPGWRSDYSDAIEARASQYGVSFDVLELLFSPSFDEPGELTFYTKRPYLYQLEDGALTPVASHYENGAHQLTTDTLGCYLASSCPLPLE